MIAEGLQHLAHPIKKLKPLPGNPRRGNVEAVAKSYQQFGQRKPLVALKDGTVIAGNHQLKAAQQLGWTEIAVVFVDDDEATAKAYALADNRTADLGSYDDEALAELISDIAHDADLLMASGYTAEDLDALIAGIDGTTQIDPEVLDQVPDSAPAKTVRGDVWLLGEHRLMCGDSTVTTDVERLMNGKKAVLVFTDPPYRYKKMGDGGVFDAGYKKLKEDIKELVNFDPKDFLALLPTFFETGINAYIFCNTELVPDYTVWARSSGYNFNILTWHKTSFIPATNGHHFPDTEYLIYISKNAVWNNGQDANYGKYWVLNNEKHEDHPTIKPTEIIIDEIKISSNQRNLVVDPFGGSGSTLIAAHQTNRVCYTMELDPHYCDIICKRFQQATGIEPIAESTGNPHNFLTD